MLKVQVGISQVEVVVVLAVIVALAAGAWWLEAHGERVGEERARLAYAQRDNEQLARVAKELQALRSENERLQDEHLAEVAAIDAEGQRKLREVDGAKDRFVSDVVAGRIRLFQPDRVSSCGGDRPDGAARAAPGVDHGAGGSQLRDETALSLFLIGEAARADKVVVKLTACQRELLADRKACNATGSAAPHVPP
jgi:hypothetical protein